MPDSSFYQKNGLAIMMLARDLICMKEGDRMTPISEYSEQLGVSRWTIQMAIKFLLENDCMVFEKHGTLGTYVYQIDVEKLWNYSGWNPLLGLTPLPTCNVLEGLMTGLNESFHNSTAPILMTYMLPAQKRLESLVARRCQFTVTSRLGFELYKKDFPQIQEVMKLEGVMYSLPFKIYNKSSKFKEVKDGMSVGIYEDSLEQKYLTEKLCEGKSVIRKYGIYHELLEMFADGAIDLLVYRGDSYVQETIGKNEGEAFPIEELNRETLMPIIVANKDEYGIEKVLRNIFDPVKITKIQKEVLENKRRPKFY